MKKKLIMMALILTVVFGGCGNGATQSAQETATQSADADKAQSETAEEANAETIENIDEDNNSADGKDADGRGDDGNDADGKDTDGKDADATKSEAEDIETVEDKAAEDAKSAKSEKKDSQTSTEDKTAEDKSVAEGKDTEKANSKEGDKSERSENDKSESADAKEIDKEAKTGSDKIDSGKTDSKEDGDKSTEESEVPKLPDYTVTAFEEAKVMYASNAVNVRKGPSTEFERVGGLNRSQEVSVTGQADTGWYEIVLGEEKAFVSDKYLQNEKPAEPEPQTQAASGPVTEVKNVAGVILVGDSRFVQMQENVGPNSCTWIAENGKGYNWLNETAMARIDPCVGKGSKVLINLGVNDPEYVNKYLELVNAKAAEWVNRGAKVYYASVNPVWENPYTTEDEVHAFNAQMQSGLSSNVHWIDSHTYLESIGFKLVDGLHYNAETYQNIFAYYMSCL